MDWALPGKYRNEQHEPPDHLPMHRLKVMLLTPFYLQGEFYELNFSAFNDVFGFPPSLELPWHHVPQEFNRNVFWYEINGNYQYNTGTYKGTFIRNPDIRVAQWMFPCGVFPMDDSLNVHRLSVLYFLSCVMNGDYIDPTSFLVTQLCNAAVAL